MSKIYKKGYMEMTKKIYLESFKKCPGSLCFTLLLMIAFVKFVKIISIVFNI